jgi:hypothetical protein
MDVGDWWHSIDHDEPCRVVDIDALWGQVTCLVWMPRRSSAVRVLQARLVPLKTGDVHLLHRLSYVSAGARIIAHDTMRLSGFARRPGVRQSNDVSELLAFSNYPAPIIRLESLH